MAVFRTRAYVDNMCYMRELIGWESLIYYKISFES